MSKLLCPFCGSYSPRTCDLFEDAGCCPWEEAEEEGADLGWNAAWDADDDQEP